MTLITSDQLERCANHFVAILTVDRNSTKNAGFNISAVVLARETPFSGIFGKRTEDNFVGYIHEDLYLTFISYISFVYIEDSRLYKLKTQIHTT